MNLYTYYASGALQTKEIYDNIGLTKNTNFERYTYNSGGTMTEHISYFGGNWHKEYNFTGVLGDGQVHAQRDEVYTDVNLTNLVEVNVYTYYGTGNLQSKEIYDNVGLTKNTNYQKYTYDTNGTTILEKISYYNGKWHKEYNFTGVLGDGQIHAQREDVYTDVGLTNLDSANIYTFYASGRVETKEIYDNIGLVKNANYEKYTYYDEDFNGTGIGRIREKELGDGSKYVYTAYWDGTDDSAIMEEYDSGGSLVAVYNYYYNAGVVSGVRKIEANRTMEFEGDFARPIYDDNGEYNYENWWIYQPVYIYSSYYGWWIAIPSDGAIVKYDGSDGNYYLYDLPDVGNPWNWGSIHAQSTTPFELYDAPNGNLIDYPNLPTNLPDPMPWAAPLAASQMATASEPVVDPELEARMAIEQQLNQTYDPDAGYTVTPSLADSTTPTKKLLGN